MARSTVRKKSNRPPKQANILSIVRDCLDEGRYLDTRHATDRQSLRLITRQEIVQALRAGHHVPSRDRYEPGYHELGWSYCIEGKTKDNRHLRIIVAFDAETNTLIVTAIDLDSEE